MHCSLVGEVAEDILGSMLFEPPVDVAKSYKRLSQNERYQIYDLMTAGHNQLE